MVSRAELTLVSKEVSPASVSVGISSCRRLHVVNVLLDRVIVTVTDNCRFHFVSHVLILNYCVCGGYIRIFWQILWSLGRGDSCIVSKICRNDTFTSFLVLTLNWNFERGCRFYHSLSSVFPPKLVCREIGPALWKIGSTGYVKMSKKMPLII